MAIYPWDWIWDAADTEGTMLGSGGVSSPLPRTDPRWQTVELEMRLLRARVESLMLANVAMWELIAPRAKLTVEQLSAKMEEIDLRDGIKDGKITPPQVCGKCGRRLSARHRRCLYCGDQNLRPS